MTHYLTRIDVNPRRRGTGRLLVSPHRVHGAVSACFAPSSRPSRPLWRLDRTPGGTALYLVSDVAPDPTGFVEEYGWPLAGGWQTRDYAPVLAAIRDGARFAFRLTANPVHSVAAPAAGVRAGTRGKRLAHVTVAQQLGWFADRCASWGVSIDPRRGDSVQVVERRSLEFRRGDHTVTLGLASFEGTLEVSDAVELRRRLVEGIGSAKAYGCGLLTLAAVR